MQERLPDRSEADINQRLLGSLVEIIDERSDQFEHDNRTFGFRIDPDNPEDSLMVLTSYVGPVEGYSAHESSASIEYFQKLANGLVLLQEYLIQNCSGRYSIEVKYFMLDSDIGISRLDGAEFSEPALNDLRSIRQFVEDSLPTEHAFI